MPLFRETDHIFHPDKRGSEYFESSWMIYDKAVYPPTSEWDYSRELQIEDVDIWEVIMEWSSGMMGNMSEETSNNSGGGGGFSGVYAAWRPHAEFYMVNLPKSQGGLVTFYGPNAEKQCKKYLKSKNIPFSTYPPGWDPGVRVDRQGLHYLYKF